jgi:hypothetical protein
MDKFTWFQNKPSGKKNDQHTHIKGRESESKKRVTWEEGILSEGEKGSEKQACGRMQPYTPK